MQPNELLRRRREASAVRPALLRGVVIFSIFLFELQVLNAQTEILGLDRTHTARRRHVTGHLHVLEESPVIGLGSVSKIFSCRLLA